LMAMELHKWPVNINELKLHKLKLYAKLEPEHKLDLSNMKDSLKILDLSCCGFRQEYLDNLELIELEIGGENYIHNLNHMAKSLKKLSCYECYHFNQDSISELELEYLYIFETTRITNLNHMKKTLKNLTLEYTSHPPHIDELSLHKLHYNKNIYRDYGNNYKKLNYDSLCKKNLGELQINIDDIKDINYVNMCLKKLVLEYKDKNRSDRYITIKVHHPKKYISKIDVIDSIKKHNFDGSLDYYLQ